MFSNTLVSTDGSPISNTAANGGIARANATPPRNVVGNMSGMRHT